MHHYPAIIYFVLFTILYYCAHTNTTNPYNNVFSSHKLYLEWCDLFSLLPSTKDASGCLPTGVSINPILYAKYFTGTGFHFYKIKHRKLDKDEHELVWLFSYQKLLQLHVIHSKYLA